MCLAVPMRVAKVKGKRDDLFSPRIAVVESLGIEKEVRLDLVDRWPKAGEYLIIHAGFALHTLDEQEAEKNLLLLKEMAEALVEKQ